MSPHNVGSAESTERTPRDGPNYIYGTGCGAGRMAKSELSGTVTSFRQSKHRQDSHQTIVHMVSTEDAGKVMGTRVV